MNYEHKQYMITNSDGGNCLIVCVLPYQILV